MAVGKPPGCWCCRFRTGRRLFAFRRRTVFPFRYGRRQITSKTFFAGTGYRPSASLRSSHARGKRFAMPIMGSAAISPIAARASSRGTGAFVRTSSRDHKGPDNLFDAAMGKAGRQPDPAGLQPGAQLVRRVCGPCKPCFSGALQGAQAMRCPAFHMDRTARPGSRTCVMPRASFRSVLLRIAESTASSCRAFMQTISRSHACGPKNRCWPWCRPRNRPC